MALFSKSGEGAERTPVPFIVGVGRSGTTMLRLMLDSHPDMAIPPETHFVPDVIEAIENGGGPEQVVEAMTAVRQWGDLHTDRDEMLARLNAIEDFNAGTALRSFYEEYASRFDKPRWGEKTPAYVRKMRKIEGVLPEARFIHVIRDGRDVCLSRWKRNLGKDPAPAGQVAEGWQRRIRRAQKQGKRLDHYLELRYEDLVIDTEPVLKEIAAFIELDWDPVMLKFYEGAAERMAEMAGDLPFDRWQADPTRRGAHAGSRDDPEAARPQRYVSLEGQDEARGRA